MCDFFFFFALAFNRKYRYYSVLLERRMAVYLQLSRQNHA